MLAATSICFDLSIFELFAPLSAGGTVVLVDDVLTLATLPGRDWIRLINTVPSVLAELVARLPASVRTVNLAGEALPADLVAALTRTRPAPTVRNLYGPTEDTTYRPAQ